MEAMIDTLPPEASELLAAANMPLRRMKRSEYELLVSNGCFEDERVELLFGLVVPLAPISPWHAEATMRMFRFLCERIKSNRANIRAQVPFAALGDSEPQPDVFVCPAGDYSRAHPERALLVVEVASASLKRDRAKRRIYARAEVDEYWIVNQEDDCVEVYTDARDGEWTAITIGRRGDTLWPLAFPDIPIAVADLLMERDA
jgi:Uma2 family endonuclease